MSAHPVVGWVGCYQLCEQVHDHGDDTHDCRNSKSASCRLCADDRDRRECSAVAQTRPKRGEDCDRHDDRANDDNQELSRCHNHSYSSSGLIAPCRNANACASGVGAWRHASTEPSPSVLGRDVRATPDGGIRDLHDAIATVARDDRRMSTTPILLTGNDQARGAADSARRWTHARR